MTVSTLALTDYRRPKIYRGGTQVEEYAYGANLEANSMTFTTSHFVYAAPAITDAEPSTMILGLAGKAATEVTSSNIQIPVSLILPGDVLMINVEDGSLAFEASDTTCNVGEAYGICAYTANRASAIDSSNSSNKQFIYLGPVLDATGASTYWGWFAPGLETSVGLQTSVGS